MPKRIMYYVLSIMLLFCMLHTTSYLLPTVHAQSPAPLPLTLSPLPSSVAPTSPLYTDLILHNMFHSLSCLGIGQSIIGQPCLTYLQGVPMLSAVNTSGGLLGTTSNLIGALYTNPPIRTSEYLASLGEGFGVVKSAHAQVTGSGANVLEPILALWQVSRNISYLIMIVIFVIVGLMVMFKQRINPQTVITAQAALPGLVIGLIMITFSYFLAGLLTDLSFVGVNVVSTYFSAAQPGSSPKLAQDIANDSVGTIVSRYVGMISSGDISSVINSVLKSLDTGTQAWVRLFAGIIGFQTGASIGGPIGAIGGPVVCGSTGIGVLILPFCSIIGQLAGSALAGTALGGLAYSLPGETFGLVLYFVAIAAVIYTMFKLLLTLLKNYLSIIFLTVTAPFHFLAASLPGRQGLTTDWIRNMLCNVLAFPAVFAVLYFVAYLLGPNTAPGTYFGITAPLNPSGNSTLPLFGGLDLSFIRILLAFGAILATPTVPDIICRTIGKVSQAGQLIGQEISGGTRSGQGYAGQVGAVPGHLGGSLGKYGEGLGGKYEEITLSSGAQTTIHKPSIFGRWGGKGPEPVLP